jgi:uncharacterized membrane protein YhaH (DUF805 family)
VKRTKYYLEALVWHIIIAGLGYLPTLLSIEWMRSKEVSGPIFVVGATAVYSITALIIANLFAIPAARFNIWRLGDAREEAGTTDLAFLLKYWMNVSTVAAALLFVCLFFGRKFV